MLSRADLAEVATIFGEAIDLGPVARATLIDARCGSRADLRAEIDSLLAAHERADLFLEPPARGTIATHTWAPREGAIVGAWRLRQAIGSGGMGDVYLAERSDGVFKGRAAVKFMRAPLPDADAVRRFRAERQFLASLHHTSIVTLLDGGTTADGQAYLVMAYVEGMPITTFCQTFAPTLDARLALVQRICAAVQYAHQRAIVHLDLKPTNILVTADGAPTILDFGVAKLLDGAATDGTVTMGTLPRALTPNYASPEQLRALPITTACDVYSLGVLLYEVIAGARPYETTGKPLDAVLKAVVETEPCAPSAAHSDAPLPYARERLRGDLDAIVLKAMRKEPEQRYRSAGELGDDLGRVLKHEPVLARAPSLGYMLRRAALRQRSAVAVAAVALVAILGALGTTLWQAQAARAERDRARLEAAKAQQVSSFLRTLFSSSYPRQARGEKLTAHDLLEIGVRRLDRDLAGQPDVQASMLAVLGSVYGELSLPAQALPLLEKSLALRETLFGPTHVEVAESLYAMGRVKGQMGDFVSAQRLLERAVAIRHARVGDDDTELPPVLSELGMALWRLGKHREGRPYLERAVTIEEAHGGPDLLRWLANLSNLELGLGDYDRARKLLERSLEIGVRMDGRRSERVDVTMLNLGSVLHAQEDYVGAKALLEEALTIGERIYGTEHQAVSYALGELGALYLAMGDTERARTWLDRSIDMGDRVLGVDHLGLAAPLTYRGRLLLAEGKPREALLPLERALRLRRRALGENHSDIAENLTDIARVKAALDDDGAAEPLLRRALAMQRETLTRDHPALVPTLTALGELLLERGAFEPAQSPLREAVDIARKRLPQRHSQRQRAEAALTRASH